MATFAKSSFTASTYAAFRPTYPPRVITHLLSYQPSPANLLVDLGCGHGAIPRSLSPHFKHVIGLDPSSSMISQAQSLTPASQYPGLTFRQCPAEDLSFVKDGEIDMVIACQAAHWFDYSKVWPLLARKVRSGGSLGFVGYKDNYFVEYPAATKVFDYYCYHDEQMGPYWEQPGRNILRDLMRAVVPPEQDWKDIKRIEYQPKLEGKGSGEGEVLWGKRLKLGEVEAYVRTFSAYFTWKDAHPNRESREDGGKGDIVDEMFDKVVESEPEWRGRKDWKDIEVENEWGHVILLAKRR